MFCKKCGTKLEDGSNFCGKCGTPQMGATKTAENKLVPNIASQSHAAAEKDISLNKQVESQITNESTNSAFVTDEQGIVVLESSAPIPTKAGWTTNAYIACIVLSFLSGFLGFKDLSAIFIMGGPFVVYLVEKYTMKFHEGRIRTMKFKFVNNASPDDLYNRLHPALVAKLGNNVSFERDADMLSVEYDEIIYDIHIKEDSTFTIWWRKSIAGALFSWNEWKLYKKIRTGTAIIAYELQHQFGIV